MRAPSLFIALSLACGFALAQDPAPASPASPAAGQARPPAGAGQGAVQDTQDNSAAPGKRNQRIERIHVEDAGSRVDETRVGGQTQSITVQPKVGEMPSYEVQSNDGARSSRSRSDTNDTTGTRVWNVIKF
ncbi:hypothetical protein V8Z74_02255 [Comamonas sp. w2-DMI]|uniref:hypothetical protein n=1 Tax=Comamonas sp. w2-DMI TaxID=3126391 RepID=UPI0032E45FF6